MTPTAPPGGVSKTIASSPRPRSTLRRVLTWAVVLLLLLVVLVIALVLFRNPLLRVVTEYSITHQTGLEADIGSLRVGFAAASLSVTDLVLESPPGFGDSPLLHMPELYVKLDPVRSVENSIAFEEIRFHLATLSIVKDPSGHYNFDAITNTPTQHRNQDTDDDETPSFGGIGKLTLTLGTLNYTDLANPEFNTETVIDLHAETSELRSAQDLTNWVGGLITRVALEQFFKQSNRNKTFWKQLLAPSASP